MDIVSVSTSFAVKFTVIAEGILDYSIFLLSMKLHYLACSLSFFLKQSVCRGKNKDSKLDEKENLKMSK